MTSILQFSIAQNDPAGNIDISANIQSGLSALRDGINDAIDRTGDCISNHIITPVNNFLKDFTQIEYEFKKVQETENEFRICINGEYLTSKEVLKLPMEENY